MSDIPGPNPFVVEDPEDPATATPNAQFAFQAQQLNVNKEVPLPPPPVDEDDDEEEEQPEIYLPQLVMPTMFLPLPNSDPLANLLSKHIPVEHRPNRDLVGAYHNQDFHTLVMTSSWRALAMLARDRLVSSTDPEDLSLVLSLWHLRLSALARLRLYAQVSQECNNLFNVLNGIPPENQRERHWLFEKLLPFELEVMWIRIRCWSGEHQLYLEELAGLAGMCRRRARAVTKIVGNDNKKKDQGAVEREVAMWKERGARVGLMMASQLIEMKDLTAATRLLTPLTRQSAPSPALYSAIARIYLQAGCIPQAETHFNLASTVAENAEPSEWSTLRDSNDALLAAAKEEWTRATQVLKEMVERDEENYVAVNNLAVALLSQGKLKEGIEVLETALKGSPAILTSAEPFLFNLSTLYELRSAMALDKKRELLVQVAKWGGDGIRTACLKIPSN